MHISANAVSYFNILVAISAAVMLLLNNYIAGIVGAILVNVWIVLDCVDGNIARSVRKQPYGEYADSVSSYFLVPLLCISTGIYVYNFGGVFFERMNIWIVLVASLVGLSDTMMRLVYHKYKEVTKKMESFGIVTEVKDERNDHSKVGSIKVFIECFFGIGGIIPLFILFAVIFNFVDIFILYCLCYYGGSFILTFLLNTWHAMKYGKMSFQDPEDKDVQI